MLQVYMFFDISFVYQLLKTEEELLQVDTNLFELKDSDGATIFHLRAYRKEFIKKCIEKLDPEINLFELRDEVGNTIFHRAKYNEDFINELPCENIFDVRNSKGDTIFHTQKYDKDFILESAEKYGVNLFELRNERGDTIFHKNVYDTEFMEKLPCKNLFELKNDQENSIFYYQMYEENFLKKHIIKYNVNPFELKFSNNSTIFHEFYYSEEFIKWCLDRYPRTRIFKVVNTYGSTIFHSRKKYSERFLKELLYKEPVNVFELENEWGDTILTDKGYSADFIKYCKRITRTCEII